MNKKVAISFSGGKDSMLALHRAILHGYKPIALITTVNKTNQESYFHNISIKLLEKVSISINIPLVLIECYGNDYEEQFIKTLKNLDVMGCVFGDIDIETHREWGEAICKKSGIKSIFPLWKEKRENVVMEFLNLGYKAIIKKIDLKRLDRTFLGQTLNYELLDRFKNIGVDICGENGEYHTFVYDGPNFLKPIDIRIERKIIENEREILKLL